jgi:heme oxygenase
LVVLPDALFQHTGLERTQPLDEDLAWFKATYNITPPTPAADGPGHTYRGLIERLAVEDPPAFICHYYNYYFAHTAGGRMIGNKVGVD